jgi:hypothetical protein
VGVDFGGVHTAAVFFAEDPGTKILYAYREYLAGQKTAAMHVGDFVRPEPRKPIAFGGAKSEGQWREEFKAGGLVIKQPRIPDVEVGINAVYACLARRDVVFFDDLDGVINEFNTYSRETDEYGEPTEDIADKNTFHRLDAVRYILPSIRGMAPSTSQIFNPPTVEDTMDPDRELVRAVRYGSI